MIISQPIVTFSLQFGFLFVFLDMLINEFQLPVSFLAFIDDFKTAKDLGLGEGPATLALGTTLAASLKLAIDSGFEPQLEAFDLCVVCEPLALMNHVSDVILNDKMPSPATLQGYIPGDELFKITLN